MIKRFFNIFALLLSTFFIVGCSTNPATGQNQFTAFMSPEQEKQVGAQEHQKVLQEYGLYKDQKLQDYVTKVGQSVVKHTERPEVQYKFFLLDSPIVNAFALPGGYIYLTRGVMALSNSESEMAAVLGHEAGHITGRHSAERYSRGLATTLGASILAAAIDSSGVSQALGVGSDLYLKSYSRGQESEADTLGIRYLTRAGYDPNAMSGFLRSLQADSALQAKMAGVQASSANSFFSTHPDTGQRVQQTVIEAREYGQQGIVNQAEHFRLIDGMVYGDSEKQGFARGRTFYHPELGFKFSVPKGYTLTNQPTQVVAKGPNNGAIIFDFASNKQKLSPQGYMHNVWLKDAQNPTIETITINGMQAATASLQGSANGRTVTLRLIAVQWMPDQIARFHIVLPSNITRVQLDSLKAATYTFSRMTASEKAQIKPYRIKIITSRAGDSVASLSRSMPFEQYKEERFRVLNNMSATEAVVANRLYKMVVD
ncbi:MAG: M48 family metalloprotease [Alcanivorax sp.]